MNLWPWWLSGLALAGVMLFHWLSLHRMMAVSGRVTALVDRLRHGVPEETRQMSPEEMMAAIQAATLAEFGPEDETIEAPVMVEQPRASAASLPTANVRTPLEHALFLGGLIIGGAVASALAGGFDPTMWLRSEGFSKLTGGNSVATAGLLVLGGAFVGFGTRMAGGCTSGHGLCGTSRFQPGSIVATMSFFGAGIATSFALGMFL